MKKLFFALLALMGNMALFSCSDTALADDTNLYHQQATEGEDGGPEDDPDDPDNDDNP